MKIGLLRPVEQPPAQRSRSSVAQRIAAEVAPRLRDKPGTWFLVAEFEARSSASTAASRLRKLAPECEWRSHKPPHEASGSHLYCRWRTAR